ncbi:MAG: hypothetical protein HFH60_09590 [Lachnospiraceae bacterium]|nr:hypothetical protein [Lachnospiraceae bacterium]
MNYRISLENNCLHCYRKGHAMTFQKSKIRFRRRLREITPSSTPDIPYRRNRLAP